MTRAMAKEMAHKTTMQQIIEMLVKAKEQIKDWKQPNRMNKGLSNGAVFNIMAVGIKNNAEWNWLAKTNAIHAFGEYHELFEQFQTKKKPSRGVFHQEPIDF